MPLPTLHCLHPLSLPLSPTPSTSLSFWQAASASSRHAPLLRLLPIHATPYPSQPCSQDSSNVSIPLKGFLLPKDTISCRGLNCGQRLADKEEAGKDHVIWLKFLRAFLTVSRSLPILCLVIAFCRLQPPALAASERGTSVITVAEAIKGIQIFQFLASGWAGFMAGCLHALTGVDHLAALAPLCIGRAKLESAAVGALWGCGHDTGQVLFGLVFLFLKDRLHLDLFRTWAARVVGVTLLLIGIIGLKEAQEVPLSVLAGAINTSDLEEATNGKNIRKLRTFATGLVYGMQPDALFMILPAVALPSRIAGAAFLCMFLCGTVLSMASYTAFIGSCGEALQKRLPGITRRLSIGSSLIAMAFGIGVLLSEFLGISFF